MPLPLLGFFGGAFDPIHHGHLYIVIHLFKQLPFEKIQFIPSGTNPPHREAPIASIKDRLNMIQLAIGNDARLDINKIETETQEKSYSINTIKKVRTQFPGYALGFILSTDNLATFHQWQEWKIFLNYSHLIIVPRHHCPLPNEHWLNDLLKVHRTYNPKDLTATTAGKIWFSTIKPPPYSATKIRQDLKNGNVTAIHTAVPEAVAIYLKQHALYTTR